MSPLAHHDAERLVADVHACFADAGVDTAEHCDIASDVIGAMLQRRGCAPALVLGTYFFDAHFWIECDGLLLDATIDQFDDTAPMCRSLPDALDPARYVRADADRQARWPLRTPEQVRVELVARARHHGESREAYERMLTLLG